METTGFPPPEVAVDDLGQVPDPAYVAGLTRVRAAAGVLYRDGQGRDGALTFVFDGGVLSESDTDAIRLAPGGEVSGWRFLAAADLDAVMVPRLAQRIRACLARPSVGTYLEGGRPPAP